MERLEEFIEKKKLSSAKTPRYGMKKLAVGLVSCILGYTILVAPSVSAESVNSAYVLDDAVVDDAVVLTESTETIVLDDAVVSGDKVYSKPKEAVVMEEKPTEAVVLEDDEAESVAFDQNAAMTRELKEKTKDNLASQFDASSYYYGANTAGAVRFAEYTNMYNETSYFGREDINDLGLSNSEMEDALRADAGAGEEKEIRDAKDISNDIINPRVSIRNQNTTKPGTLDAGHGEQLTWFVSFTTPEGTKEGDTFTVKLSDNMSLKGLEPDTDYALPVKFGDKIIATAKRIDRQTIQYTFTKDIEDYKYARVYIINSAQENKDVVKNSGNQTFKINVGENAKDEEDINVDFGKVYHAKTSENVNGKSQFTEFNPEDGSFTQVFYLNPESKVINTSSTNDQNGREFGKVGFLLSSPHDADKPRSVDYLENNTKIDIKKLPKGAKLPDAIIENPEGAQAATNIQGGFRNFKGEPMFTMNFGGGNKIDSPYVVVVKGHANKIDGKYTELYSNGTLYGDGEASLFLDNLYTVQENSTDSEGVKETLGYFKEHHIYITKENGKETSRFEIPGATVSGTAEQYYYTNKNIIPGYHFVKVDTDKLVENPAYDPNGELKQGNFEVGKTKEVTYIYEKDITTSGSFTEHHVYEVYKDGELIETSKIDIEKTTGTEKDTFTTSAKPNGTEKDPKEGFTLVADKITKSPEIKVDVTGAVVTPNYINEKDLEVTYVYRKDITTSGSFTEHHVYEVYKDGELIETSKIDVEKTTGTEKDTFTTSAKPNGTEKDPKDGFTLVEDRITKSPEIKVDVTGAEVTPNYINEKDLEVTYVYRKDITTSGSFQEHHIYQTKKLDGTIVEDSRDDKEVTEGTEKQNYKTSKIDKEGYTLVKIESTNGGQFNKDGSEKEAAYIADIKQEVTYIYQREEQQPVEKKGSFQEHHIYQTKKLDGTIVKDDEVNKDETTGTEKENYKTSKQDREGYTLIEVRSINGGQFNKDGSEKEAAYIADIKQEVTYIYQREEQQPVEKKGSFQEHHIYQTKKLDGTIVEDSRDDKKVTEGTEKENYKTSKIDKEGYTLIKVESTNGGQFNEDGSPKEAAYIADTKQEVTYIYQREEIKPVEPEKPTEPEEPIQPVTPEEPIKPEEPEKPIEPEKPYEPERPEYPEEPERPHRPRRPRTPEVEEEKPEPKEEPKIIEYKEFPKYYAPPVETTEVAETPVAQETPIEETPIEETPVVETPVVETPEDYSKAPQTSVPGAAGYIGLAGLASAALAYIEDKKRKNK